MNERLNISDLAGLLAAYTGKDKKETELFLKELLLVISDALLEERIVKVKGLGTFKVVQVEERESVHVNTGERFVIPAHSKFTFTPDKELRELVNKPFSSFETTELNDGVVFSEEQNNMPEEEEDEERDETNQTNQTDQSEKTPSSAPPERRSGTLVFIGLFLVACIIGVFYFLNFNQKKTDNIKDIKRQERTVVKSASVEQEKIEEIFPADSLSSAEQPIVDTIDIVPQKAKEPVKVKIVPDTRLTLIALEHYGHKAFWVYIYEHNKNIITNPNNIRIGTELVLPDPALYGIDAKNPESVAKAKAKQAEINSRFN